MRQVLKTIIDMILFKYHCECGFKTNSIQKFTEHQKQHPIRSGTLIYESGEVIW